MWTWADWNREILVCVIHAPMKIRAPAYCKVAQADLIIGGSLGNFAREQARGIMALLGIAI